MSNLPQRIHRLAERTRALDLKVRATAEARRIVAAPGSGLIVHGPSGAHLLDLRRAEQETAVGWRTGWVSLNDSGTDYSQTADSFDCTLNGQVFGPFVGASTGHVIVMLTQFTFQRGKTNTIALTTTAVGSGVGAAARSIRLRVIADQLDYTPGVTLPDADALGTILHDLDITVGQPVHTVQTIDFDS